MHVFLLLLCLLVCTLGAFSSEYTQEKIVADFFNKNESKHTNNWAVLVCSSRYWFNYRASAKSVYSNVPSELIQKDISIWQTPLECKGILSCLSPTVSQWPNFPGIGLSNDWAFQIPTSFSCSRMILLVTSETSFQEVCMQTQVDI